MSALSEHSAEETFLGSAPTETLLADFFVGRRLKHDLLEAMKVFNDVLLGLTSSSELSLNAGICRSSCDKSLEFISCLGLRGILLFLERSAINGARREWLPALVNHSGGREAQSGMML